MIVIYGRDDCPYCVKAKDFCIDNNLNYEYKDIVESNISREQLCMVAGIDVQTVPVVLVDGTYIGGFEELCDYAATNLSNEMADDL